MILTAAYVLPISSPPIQKGAIVIHKGVIVAVGAFETIRKEYPRHGVKKYPHSILLPGFVNTHCHLEFSDLTGTQNPQPSFATWAQSMTPTLERKKSAQIRVLIQKGELSLLTSGVTTVVDHIAPEILKYCPKKSSLNRIFFLEVLGSNQSRAQSNLKRARQIQKTSTIKDVDLTPHSLYAVHNDTLLALSRDVKKQSFYSLHILESQDEYHFFHKQSGPLVQLVQKRGGEIAPQNPLSWLSRHGFLSAVPLMVHGNYLSSEDMKIMKRHGLPIAHCPGSHSFFGHRPFPLAPLLKHGITIALGTDSGASISPKEINKKGSSLRGPDGVGASNKTLSMLAELQQMQKNFPRLSARDIVTMATLNGAKAIHREDTIGSLVPGKNADVIAIKINHPRRDPYENVIRAQKTQWTMINGKRTRNI
jgi:cytosine/adenosine deaminase-related metal-dependent hydrolase